MRKAWLAALVLVMAAALASTAFAQGGAVERIQKAGVLKIGSTVTGIPTTFLDEKTKKVVGIMVDVGQAIADHLKVKLEVVETPWSALIPSLQSHKIDLLCAAMYITDERKKVIDFSEPVYPYCEALVVKADDKKAYKSIEDLKGMKVGGQVGTIYIKGMEERGVKDVKVYDTMGDILTDITNGRLDAAVMDGPVARWQAKTKPEFKVRVVETYQPVMCGNIGVGVAKDDPDLLKVVNVVVAKLKADGKVKEILKKWGQE